MIRALLLAAALLALTPPTQAITLVGAVEQVYLAATGSPAAMTLEGAQVGDVILVFYSNNRNNSSETVTVTASGETFSELGSAHTGANNTSTYRRRKWLATVANAGDITVTVSNVTDSNASAFNTEAWLLRGATVTGALAASANGTGTNASFSIDTTTLGANAAIFVAGVNAYGSELAGTASYTTVEMTNIDGYERAEYLLDAGAAGNKSVAMVADLSGDWTIGGVALAATGGGPTREQEGFRWGVDDGNEAAHTFEAAQDTNISIADTQSRLLRALVNGTGDPATAAYTLRSQKNGAGGYVAVPVGSTTAGAGISNQTVAASADDSQEATGGTNTINGTTIGGSLDATTEWAGMRFTNIAIPVGATITAATVGVVPSATGEDEPLVTVYFEAADDCAAFTTGASNISGRSRTTGVSWSSADLAATGASYHDTPSLVSDLQAVINRAGWASGNDVCVLIQGGSNVSRDLTIEAQDLGPNTNPPRLSVSWTTPNEIYISTSANITAGGEATTARLTAPSGKTTSDFVTGRRWDDENGSDSIDITTDDYTEVEWRVTLSATPAASDYFEFRVYAGSSALDTYTLTPRWSIPGAATAVTIISQVNL